MDAVAGPAARIVSSMVSRPNREMEIGSGGKAGTATIANWPNSPARNAGSTSPTVSVVTSWVSRPDRDDPGGRERAGRRGDGGRARAGSGRTASGGAIGEQLLRGCRCRRGTRSMQRPQPTHPKVPNWSTQVANLWVSHWR